MEISSIASGKRSVGPSDGVYKMRRLSFPNPLIWIFFAPAVAAAACTSAVCSALLLFLLPLVLGDIYLLKEVVTKDVARNFTAAAALDGDADETIRATPLTSRSCWALCAMDSLWNALLLIISKRLYFIKC